MAIKIAAISDTALDVAVHFAAVQEPWVGGVTSFVGTVRAQDPDAATAVVALEYSAHPDAEVTLRDIVTAAVGETQAAVAVSHRIGRLEVGDIAVVIVVGTAHRDAAFTICRDIIERIKAALPVWKKQWSADGDAVWKGIGG